MIEYIQKNGNSYKTTLEGIYKDHEQNLLAMVKQISDPYFSEQNSLMNDYNSKISKVVSEQQTEIHNF